jgi:hypothetical protein
MKDYKNCTVNENAELIKNMLEGVVFIALIAVIYILALLGSAS